MNNAGLVISGTKTHQMTFILGENGATALDSLAHLLSDLSPKGLIRLRRSFKGQQGKEAVPEIFCENLTQVA